MRVAAVLLSLLGLAVAGCSSSSGGGGSSPSKTYVVLPNGQTQSCTKSNGTAC